MEVDVARRGGAVPSRCMGGRRSMVGQAVGPTHLCGDGFLLCGDGCRPPHSTVLADGKGNELALGMLRTYLPPP